MNLKTKIKEDLRLLVVDRLVDKYIEEDRSNNIFDLSITRLAAHRNKAFRVWKLLNPVQKENSLEKINTLIKLFILVLVKMNLLKNGACEKSYQNSLIRLT